MQTRMACLLLLVLAAAPFMVDATFSYRYPSTTTTSCCSTLSPAVQTLQADVQSVSSQVSALSADLSSLLSGLRAVQYQLANQQVRLNALAACDCALINQRLDDLTTRVETLEALVDMLSMDPVSTPATTTSTTTPPTTTTTTTEPTTTTTTEPTTTTTTEPPTTTTTTTEPPTTTTTTTEPPTTTTTTTEPPTTTTTTTEPPTTTTTTTEPPTTTTTTTEPPTTTTTTTEPPTTTTTTTEPPTTTTTTTTTETTTTTTLATTTPGPQEGALRLVNGSTPFEGRLEIFLNGEWGTICQDLWNTVDAVVACNQLGLPSDDPIAYRGNLPPVSPFGSGTGQIWLDDLRCTGDEQMLILCRVDSDGDNNCDHSQDVGLLCQ